MAKMWITCFLPGSHWMEYKHYLHLTYLKQSEWRVCSGPVIFPELRVSGTSTIDQTVNIRNPLEGSSANQSLEEYVAAVSKLQTEVQLLKDALPTVLYHFGQQAITGFISAASLTVDNAHFDELTLHKVNGHSLDSITREFLLDGVDQNVQESWRANYMEVDVFTTRGSPIAGTISGVLTSVYCSGRICGRPHHLWDVHDIQPSSQGKFLYVSSA
ncbi:uncharacterized protein [Panulirus ornatus]|uniref:uncharacterized protein isoform X5 n=1 Tax=Panulirus ornatus TaxID=150431 RepID=UPI003A8BA98A